MHIQLTFKNITAEQKELLIAHLYEHCDGFEEFDDSLKAVLTKENISTDVQQLFNQLQLVPEIEKIPVQNWNELWESNFTPVIIDDKVAVRAGFHDPIHSVAHEIIITPKMSFGTGHHATTSLMIALMCALDFTGKNVFDFGTGTGILAILAKKLGAANVIASDVDSWSIENAKENFEANHISTINLIQDDQVIDVFGQHIILANINKNVLLHTIPSLSALLEKNGSLLLSGLLESDEEEISILSTNCGLSKEEKCAKNGWIALRFNKL
ncbi:MAG: 50S ribosomal protein L11 methyltransferase [Niabella sp.]